MAATFFPIEYVGKLNLSPRDRISVHAGDHCVGCNGPLIVSSRNNRAKSGRAWCSVRCRDIEWARHHPAPAGISGNNPNRNALRLVVYVRDNFTCQDCGRAFPHALRYRGGRIEGLTLGHILPKAWGGRWSPENLIAQCAECNGELGCEVWRGARYPKGRPIQPPQGRVNSRPEYPPPVRPSPLTYTIGDMLAEKETG